MQNANEKNAIIFFKKEEVLYNVYMVLSNLGNHQMGSKSLMAKCRLHPDITTLPPHT